MASGVGSDRRAVDKDLARLAAGVRRAAVRPFHFNVIFI